MSSRTKGYYSVKRATEYYNSLGYIVDSVEKTGKFRKYKDLFSEWFDNKAGFDLLGVSQTNTPVLIQVTTNKPKVHKNFQKFADIFGHLIDVQQYVRTKRGKPDLVFLYLPGNAKQKIEVRNNGETGTNN